MSGTSADGEVVLLVKVRVKIKFEEMLRKVYLTQRGCLGQVKVKITFAEGLPDPERGVAGKYRLKSLPDLILPHCRAH